MENPFDFDTEINRRAVPALKWHKMVLGADGAGLFPAGVADMDFAVAPAITDALHHRAAHALFGYETLPDGLVPAVTHWMAKRHNWQVSPDQILRAPNVLNSLAMAVNLFSNPKDKIIIQPPVFFDFADVITENDRVISENPLLLSDGRYAMDFDGLEPLAADTNAKILLLCNPHNPVGRAWSKEELTRLGDICARHGVLVVSDEIHGDLTYPGHRYTPFASLGGAPAQNAITLLSPAKSFNIAACCSAFTVIDDPEKRAAFQAENSRLTVNKNNAFANVAMEAAYRDGGAWLDAVRLYLAGNLDLVRLRLGRFAGVRFIEPEASFLLWLDFRELGMTPDDLTAFLRHKAGWAATRGVSFGTGGAGFMRLNIACPRARLALALDQLEAAVLAL